MACREIFIQFRNIFGAGEGYYDLVDLQNRLVFANLHTSQLALGMTFSVEQQENEFRLTNFRLNPDPSPCQTTTQTSTTTQSSTTQTSTTSTTTTQTLYQWTSARVADTQGAICSSSNVTVYATAQHGYDFNGYSAPIPLGTKIYSDSNGSTAVANKYVKFDASAYHTSQTDGTGTVSSNSYTGMC